jgi:putative addiction module component (TIGR02574 family)
VSSVDDAFFAAQGLGPSEKLQLISRIWESIPLASWRPSDSDLEEIKRRWSEYEAGEAETIPWEEVRDEVRRKLDKLKANG